MASKQKIQPFYIVGFTKEIMGSSDDLHRKLMNLAVQNLQICHKVCTLVGKQWTLRHLTF